MDTHGKPISREEFEKMRKAYASANPGKTQAVLFSNESIDRLRSHKEARGVRVYFGIDEKGKDTVMLMATDADGKDLQFDPEDRGQLCPPYCP